MIKYHFDDENEVRRLLMMITQAVTEEDFERLSSYEYLVERADRSSQLEKVIEEKDNVIAEIKEENRKLKDQLAVYEKYFF